MSHHGYNRLKTSDEWYTPPKVFSWLGNPKFDVDPFPAKTARFSSVRAERMLTDGMTEHWGTGLAWVNGPFSVMPKVVHATLQNHQCDALFIGFSRTETGWFQRVVKSANVLFFPDERVRYIDGRETIKRMVHGPNGPFDEDVANPDYGKQAGSPGAPSFIAAFGGRAVACVEHAVRNGHGVAVSKYTGEP